MEMLSEMFPFFSASFLLLLLFFESKIAMQTKDGIL